MYGVNVFFLDSEPLFKNKKLNKRSLQVRERTLDYSRWFELPLPLDTSPLERMFPSERELPWSPVLISDVVPLRVRGC